MTKGRVSAVVLRTVTYLAAGVTIAAIVSLLGWTIVNGLPHLKPELFSLAYTSGNASLIPALVTTVIMTVASLVVAVPVGVFAAIWLAEYARRGNRLVAAVRLAAETLTGIPSIIYGMFGMLLFVVFFGWGLSVLAGACTLAIMILPVVMRTTEEALIAVPDAYREGSYGLGAGKLRTVFAIVLPAAAQGICSGVVLATGRVLGETAALIFTAGTVAKLPDSLFSSARTLSVHVYALSSEGLYVDQAYATAVVLLVLAVAVNALSALLSKKLGGVNG